MAPPQEGLLTLVTRMTSLRQSAHKPLAILPTLVAAILLLTAPANGDPPQSDKPTTQETKSASSSSVLEELKRAKSLATRETYRLRYQFRKGDILKWKVVHLATTETVIQDKPETSKTRSVAVRHWKVLDVDDEGNATIEVSVEYVDMWQKISDREEVRYDSRTDKTPPPEYLAVAETVGVPLLKAKVTPNGQIIQRDRPKKNFDLGLGDMTIPFPKTPLSPGQSWYVPRNMAVQLPGGTVKQIKIRQKYTLVKVETGVATIRVQSQPITPINNPQIEAQLMQDLIDGTIRFDVDAGRLISRQVDWDDMVLEFAGPSSMIKYRARLTETHIPSEPRTANAQSND